MTTTLADATYVEEALEALEKVKDDAALNLWDETWCSGERYINLATPLVRKREDGFDAKLRWLCGFGAG